MAFGSAGLVSTLLTATATEFRRVSRGGDKAWESIGPDNNHRFFIEQVSHHPPVGAAWAESPEWTGYGESAVKSKFYSRPFDINPLGTWFSGTKSINNPYYVLEEGSSMPPGYSPQ